MGSLHRFGRSVARQFLRRDEDIFDGQGHLFKEALTDCSLYGEYGMGASTSWVLANTRAVDTSREWVERVVDANGQSARLSASWIDVGPVAKWGRPISYARREHFHLYVEALWRETPKPQTVLIDGRFRVCCFLHTLLHSDPGTRIVVDDYAGRPQYHLVQELVAPAKVVKRQALFVTPASFDHQAAAQLRDRFLYVLD